MSNLNLSNGLSILPGVAVVVLLAACSPPRSDLASMAALSDDTAEQVESMLLYPLLALSDPQSLATGTPGQAPGASGAVASGSAQATEDCVDEPAVVDADADGIPDQQTITFDCSISFEHASFGGSGTITLNDTDDANPVGGFTAELVAEYAITIEAETIRTGLDFILTVAETTNSSTSVDYDGTFTFVSSLVEIGIDSEVSMTHTGASFDAGTLEINGDITYSWAFDCSVVTGDAQDECRKAVEESGSSTGTFSLSIASSDLEYDTNACATSIVGGSVVLRDSTGASASISYAGCDESTVTN